MKRMRGFINLVFDLVDETSNLVERTHDEVVERSVRRFAAVEPAITAARVVTGIQGAIAGTVFKSIRGINGVSRRSVNTVADLAEKRLAPALDAPAYQLATPMQSSALLSPRWCIDYLQATVNGFWGDYLSRQTNPLAEGMTVRHNGQAVAMTKQAFKAVYPRPTDKLCIFVHGLASTEWLWCLSSAQHYDGDEEVSFGSRLHDDLGYTPVYIRYNTGLHISDNGRQLASLLSDVVECYPLPVSEITLVGHSMGGLVIRSAASYARDNKEAWVDRLRHVACIGAPNLGAPLEKVVNLLSGVLRGVDAAGAQVPAKVLNTRSAGVKDLRYGYTLDEEWLGKDPDAVFSNARLDVPLLEDVAYYFFAATISKDPQHPFGVLLGDLLVRLPSAAGQTRDITRRIPFSSGRVFSGMSHIHIVNHPNIYEELKKVLTLD